LKGGVSGKIGRGRGRLPDLKRMSEVIMVIACDPKATFDLGMEGGRGQKRGDTPSNIRCDQTGLYMPQKFAVIEKKGLFATANQGGWKAKS